MEIWRGALPGGMGDREMAQDQIRPWKWQFEEERYLAAHAAVLPVEVLARRLRRTPQMIIRHAYGMGVKVYTAEQFARKRRHEKKRLKTEAGLREVERARQALAQEVLPEGPGATGQPEDDLEDRPEEHEDGPPARVKGPSAHPGHEPRRHDPGREPDQERELFEKQRAAVRRLGEESLARIREMHQAVVEMLEASDEMPQSSGNTERTGNSGSSGKPRSAGGGDQTRV